MGNLFASFNTGVSGLHSAQSSLYTTAHNIANATTEGYSRQQVIVTDAFYSTRYGAYANRLQIGKGTDIAEIRQVRNTFLDAQYRVQAGRQSFYEAQYKAVKEIEDLFGEMESEEFITSVTDLWSAVSNLAQEPNNIVLRSELVSTASKFTERANALRDQLVEYQTNMNQEVKNQVDQINDIVDQIRQYNELIQKYEATGESANDYRDSRNLLLDQLSTYVNVESYEEVDGTVSIYAEGQFLLESNVQHRLTTANESETSKLLKPVWEMGGDFFLRGELSYSSENDTDTGSLRGLLVARGKSKTTYLDIPQKPDESDYLDADGNLDSKAYFNATEEYNRKVEEYNENVQPSIVMTIEAEFDQLIHGIATMVNDTLCPNKKLTLADGTTITVLDTDKAPIGDDADKTIGAELFVRRETSRYTEKTVTVLDDDGKPKPVTVYQYNEENPNDHYSLYTTDQLEVNPELLRDPSKLPLSANASSGHVDGYTLDLCQDLLAKWQGKFGTMDPNSMTTYNFCDYYGAMVGQFSTLGNVWKGIIDNQETTVHSVESDRQKEMGVSTDEELADLIKYQQCYNASSRYITVVDEMIEHLLTRL